MIKAFNDSKAFIEYMSLVGSIKFTLARSRLFSI